MTTKENLTKIGKHLGFTDSQLHDDLSNVSNENINAINYVLSVFADKIPVASGAGAVADGRRRSRRRSKRKSKSRRRSKRKY